MSLQDTQGVLAQLSDKVGVPEPAFRLFLSLLFGYPMALVHRKLFYSKEPNVQSLHILGCGLLIGYFNYGFDIVHSLIAILITYSAMVAFGGTSTLVAFSFLFNMTYLLTGYYFMGTDDYDINWTLPHCVLVLRLIGLTFDYYDGQQKPEELSAENKKVCLPQRPPLVHVLAHSFFPTSYLAGPQFPIKRYIDFINGKFNNLENKSAPDSILYALERFGLGVLYLVVNQALNFVINDDYLLSDEYSRSGVVCRYFLLGLWGKSTICKYVSCWLMAEGGCILFGLTQNGTDDEGKTKWDGVENVKVSYLENSTEFNHYIMGFNVNTNHWVAQYVYKRLKFFGNRYISQAVALVFLAIWHGFHTGYYVCFFMEFLIMYVERDLQAIIKCQPKLANIIKSPAIQWPLYVALRIYTFVFMGWCLVPFVLFTFEKYWKVFRAVNFIGYIFFGTYALFIGPLLRRSLSKPRQHSE